MVATDIFGRGVDIDKVDFVVNYDLPENSDGYLHRVPGTAYFRLVELDVLGRKGLLFPLLLRKKKKNSWRKSKNALKSNCLNCLPLSTPLSSVLLAQLFNFLESA